MENPRPLVKIGDWELMPESREVNKAFKRLCRWGAAGLVVILGILVALKF